MISITATDVERTAPGPRLTIGEQIRMGTATYFYFTPETAAQWLPILTEIANEKSSNA